MKLLSKKRVSRSIYTNIVIFVFISLFALFMALPLIFAIINSFKPLNELFLFPPRFFVYRPTLDNYRNLFSLQQNSLVPFERYVFNSVFVSVAATAIYVLIASMAGYSLSKKRFPGSVLIIQIVVWAILFRPEVTAIPQYILFSKFKLVDSYLVLLLPALATSFGVFLMKQFSSTVPYEIIESAYIDGAGEYNAFFTIVMPLLKPAWLTLTLFTFQATWNITGVQYIYSESLKMLPTALMQIATAGIARAGVASAISVILMLPPIIIFIISQTSIMETMAHSGLKS